MSFYISEDLKDRITEKELIEDKPSSAFKIHEVENNFQLGLSVMIDDDLHLIKIEKLKIVSEDVLKITTQLNVSYIEQIFFKKLHMKEIVIGNTKKKIIKYELLEVEKSFDSFKTDLLVHI
tara:strand:+ start:136 stop:498 length:363 start_codon:yes stop_codon:yes gene_type:complete